MTLPNVKGLTPFESRNLIISTITFDGNIGDEIRTRLTAKTDTFNKEIPGGELKPRFFLEFSMNPATGDCKMAIRQRSLTEAPTRDLFDQFLMELGIEATQPAQDDTPTPAPVQTATPVFDAKAGRYRQGGRFVKQGASA